MVSRPIPMEPVFGTSWRRHGERRLRAARIARLLRPVTHVLGGLVSTELAVPYQRRWYRPDVGVLLGGEMPHDGVLPRAPLLVVCLGGPLSGVTWLQAGAGAVWAAGDGAVHELTRRSSRRLERGQWLAHPDEPALRLPAEELVLGPPADTRISA